MALPRFVKNLYIWKKGSSSFQQEQIVGTTFDLTTYNRTVYATEQHEVASTAKYEIYSPSGMRMISPPDTFVGKIFNIGEYISQSLFDSFVDLIATKINNNETGQFSLMKDTALATTDLIIFGTTSTLDSGNKLVAFDVGCNITTNSFNPTSLQRNVVLNFGANYVIDAHWQNGRLDRTGSYSNNCYLATTGTNYRWSQYSADLITAMKGIYNKLKTVSLTMSTGMTSSGNTFSARNRNAVRFSLTCMGFPMDNFSTERLVSFADTSSTGYGSWTQSGTIDPTDPGETPDPPVPPGPVDPPDPPVIPDPDDPITPPSLPGLGGCSLGFFTVYNPSDVGMRLIANKFWDPTFFDAIKQRFDNPMDTIIGFGIVPVEPVTGSSRHVMFGNYDSEVSALEVTSEYKIIDCGSRVLHTYYGSYLDFEPYTKVSMYLPYCGEVDMNPDEMVGKTIGVLYYVNVITGDIVAMVTADGSVIYTAASNCFRQLPMTQADYSQIIQTAVSAVVAIGAAVAGGAAGAAGASAMGAQGSLPGLVQNSATNGEIMQGAVQGMLNNSPSPSMLNSVMATKMHYKRASQLGTGSGQLAIQYPYMIVLRPNLMLPDGTGDVGTNSDLKAYKGYPCNQIVTLSSCHGLTIVEDMRLSISGATVDEIEEVLSLLKGGVIL